jgi:predicted methyltransferase
MKKMLVLISLFLITAGGPALAQHNHDLMLAVQASNRSAENKVRDVYRHPYETLDFFGIKKNFTVVEMWPGNGWYTEILAPYLLEEGTLITATYDRSDNPPAAYMGNAVKNFDAFLASNPDVYGKVVVSEQVSERVSVIAPPGTVDAILDFRNAHNWIPAGADNIIMAWHAALKQGGIVGIVDHRRGADEPFQPGTGYTHEQQVIDLMAKHGFALEARSEINANPADTKDHPGGVWNLPPTLQRVADADRAKYLAIGESDRMTLKFVKL